MNYGFVIDNRKCIGCHACTVACKAEHETPIGVNRTWVKYIEKGTFPHTRRLFSVMRCNHCEAAPCVEICPVEALHTREDGIVDFDNRRCIGCKACMQACPYDALYIDPETHTAAKCNYCSHRIDIGLEPACVNVCPEQAIISGDLNDPNSKITQLVSREQVTARKIEKGTQPNLFYIDGDHASLEPLTTEPSDHYMWNSQTAGVGHFARYAESLIVKSDPLTMATQLASKNGAHAQALNNIFDPKVLQEQQDLDVSQNGKAIYHKKTRRVYDAPAKGIVWGWEVAAYVWTKAISTGACLVPFLSLSFNFAPVSDTLQWLGWGTALFFLTLTGLLLIKDLDKPARFAYVLLRPQWKSWLVKGGYSITVYGIFLTFWAIGKWYEWLLLESLSLLGGSIFAFITAVYTAFLFAQAKGRGFWQSPALPLHMLVHSLMAGAAIFAISSFFIESNHIWNSYLRILIIGGIILNISILLSEILTVHPTEDTRQTIKMIIAGRYRRLFWMGAMVTGNIFPLVLVAIGSIGSQALAGGLLLLGIYFTEHIWIRAPQQLPLS